jgi:hypothetical protein
VTAEVLEEAEQDFRGSGYDIDAIVSRFSASPTAR